MWKIIKTNRCVQTFGSDFIKFYWLKNSCLWPPIKHLPRDIIYYTGVRLKQIDAKHMRAKIYQGEWMVAFISGFIPSPSTGTDRRGDKHSTRQQTIACLCVGTDLHNGSIERLLKTLTQTLHPSRTLQHRDLSPLPKLTSLQITVWELPGDKDGFKNIASLRKARFNNTFPTSRCLVIYQHMAARNVQLPPDFNRL